jgi:hypothetical protein
MKYLLTTILILSSTMASAEVCRDVIVEASREVGEPLAKTDFSITSFDEMNLTVEDFNLLSSEEQEAIFYKIMPFNQLKMKIYMKVARTIRRYEGTFYEYYYSDKMVILRELKDRLIACDSSMEKIN